MMRFLRIGGGILVAAAIAVSVAACGGGDDSDAADPPADSAASETTETASSTTTAAIPEGGVSIEGLQLSAVVFGDTGHATVTNTTDVDAGLDGLWLCNQPDCVPLSGTLAADSSADIDAGGLGGLSADGGEVGLYSSDAFTSPDAIIDYVQWGTGGAGAGVAVAAGLWPEGVTVMPTVELIELFGVPGDPESWS